MMGLLRSLAVVLMLGATACAPVIRFPGPATVTPALADEYVRTSDGLDLPLRKWLPPGEPTAVIVALHGFNDYSNSYAEPAKLWTGQGLAVYAYDQRGFGRGPHVGYWAGAQAMAADARQIAALVAARHPGKPIYFVGESMGGAVVMAAVAGRETAPVAGIVLSAPAVWGRSTMNVFERTGLWLFSHTIPGMLVSGGGLDITPSDNREMLRALSRDPLVIKETRMDAVHGLVDLMDLANAVADQVKLPTLVLYGEKDEIVPAHSTYQMIARLPQESTRRVAIYPNGYHMLMRDLQAKVVLNDIAAWIKDPTGPLPSGADLRAKEVLADRVKRG